MFTANEAIRSIRRALCFGLLAVIGQAPEAVAQHAEHRAPLPAATEAYPGLGGHHFPITTSNPDAQAYFDYGIGLLYGFNHDEAARYFRRAAELDPQASMPYWGLALSIGPNYNDTAVDEARARATYEAVRNAQQRGDNASDRERAYVAALAKRYPSPDPNSDWLALHRDYSDVMRAMVAQYPDDLDAATMFAESLMMLRPWQLWTPAGDPAPGTLELVAVLEAVLRSNPDHPGANHFYIHAVEASRNLERAIPSATRLMTLAPAAGHLVHMPGHIFLQTGDFELAAETNVKAAAADKAFVDRTGATGVYPLMYWTHNLHFIAYARAQQGLYENAKQAALEMIANVGSGDLEMQMLEGFRLYPLMIDLRFHRWETILAENEPAGERPLSRAFWRYARAMAYAGTGKVREAAAEQRRFEQQRGRVAPEVQYLINNKAGSLLALASATLDAQLAGARRDSAGAIGAWRRALEAEAELQYDEPPAWFYPVRQSLAAALLRGGRHAEAERVFREALAKHPRDGRLLFGLWHTLLAQDRASEARLVENQFKAAWRHATTTLTLAEL
jgi:tetratricopeptide (TPR) repeat protein